MSDCRSSPIDEDRSRSDPTKVARQFIAGLSLKDAFVPEGTIERSVPMRLNGHKRWSIVHRMVSKHPIAGERENLRRIISGLEAIESQLREGRASSL